MDRFLVHVRPRPLSLLSLRRQLSSFKPNALDLDARIVGRKTLRALLDLIDQLDASNLTSKHNLSIPPLVVDTTYASITEPNPAFPFPGRIGPDPKSKPKPRPPLPKLNPHRYGIDGKLVLNDLLTMTLPIDHQKDSLRQLMSTHMSLSSPKQKKDFLSTLMSNENLEIRAYDCPALLRYELHRLFLNYNVLMQPLTAVTIILKTKFDMSTWSSQVEDERNEVTDQFIKLAHEICAYLGTKQYWADFIDPASGRPYYGPHSSDTLFETDERFRYFGVNILDLGCCRVVEHSQKGTHVLVGCLFTSALKSDAHLRDVLKEFKASSDSKDDSLADEQTTRADTDSMLDVNPLK